MILYSEKTSSKGDSSCNKSEAESAVRSARIFHRVVVLLQPAHEPTRMDYEQEWQDEIAVLESIFTGVGELQSELAYP